MGLVRSAPHRIRRLCWRAATAAAAADSNVVAVVVAASELETGQEAVAVVGAWLVRLQVS